MALFLRNEKNCSIAHYDAKMHHNREKVINEKIKCKNTQKSKKNML
jgi:hypothetical protein